MPFLDRWAGIVVPLTLIAIGLMGIYESFFEPKEEGGHHAEEEAAAINLALAGEHRSCSITLAQTQLWEGARIAG